MALEDEIVQPNFKNTAQKAVVNIIYTSFWLQDHLRRLIKPMGLTPQAFNILRILRGMKGEPATILSLKDRMLDKSSDVSRIIDRLSIKGLVIRTDCPTDKRAVHVKITAKGNKILSKIDVFDDQMPTLFTGLTDMEIATLNKLLDKLRSNAPPTL